MAAFQNIVAVIFDFDDTLTDDSTTKLLKKHGIDTSDFWQTRMKKLMEDGWDPPLAYMKLMLDNTGDGKPLGNLTNADLRLFGSTLDSYPGIPQLFEDLQEQVKKHRLSRPSIEFHIISGGLEEIIMAWPCARHFSGIWGSRFSEEGGRIAYVKNAISYTEKTKYLFAINKGVEQRIRVDPYVVNERVDKPDRRIPFENMIYIGDGLTDVPCFSLMELFGGQAFGVFDPHKEESPKKAWEGLVAPKRVATMNSPRYGKEDDLGALLRVAVRSLCLRLDAQTGAARP